MHTLPWEEAMTTHSSTLAWKIPWTEEPGRLQSTGSLGVRHDWSISLSLFTFHFHALEKEMATHSSTLAWRISGMGEPGGLPSMGSHRVGHGCCNSSSSIRCHIMCVCVYVYIYIIYLFLQPQDWKRSVFIPTPKKSNAQRMLTLSHNCIHLTC